ncbi:MAG TPA: TIGR02444 family protein [Beijerinckiaceae bacterium]|nr:TIGR02444 family protein [Beijerinckiaceae bacterium]
MSADAQPSESKISGETSSPFWRFSLAVYAATGVADACLELQENAGADVNVLLYGLWLGTQRRRLQAEEMRAIVALIESWRREIVAPLRHVRRTLKTPPAAFKAAAAAALRRQVKRVELEAEHMQQDALYAWRPASRIGREEEKATAIAANVETYSGALGVCFSPQPVLTLISAALACAPQGGDQT